MKEQINFWIYIRDEINKIINEECYLQRCSKARKLAGEISGRVYSNWERSDEGHEVSGILFSVYDESGYNGQATILENALKEVMGFIQYMSGSLSETEYSLFAELRDNHKSIRESIIGQDGPTMYSVLTGTENKIFNSKMEEYLLLIDEAKGILNDLDRIIKED